MQILAFSSFQAAFGSTSRYRGLSRSRRPCKHSRLSFPNGKSAVSPTAKPVEEPAEPAEPAEPVAEASQEEPEEEPESGA